MGLFDGGIPKGMQMLLVNLVKDAAPQLAESVDGLGAVVRDFKAQLERIETKLNYIMENSDAGSKSELSTGRSAAGRNHHGSNPAALNGAGTETGDDGE